MRFRLSVGQPPRVVPLATELAEARAKWDIEVRAYQVLINKSLIIPPLQLRLLDGQQVLQETTLEGEAPAEP